MNQSATDTLPRAGEQLAESSESTAASGADVREGTLLAERYALEEPIGRGASGWVWRAKHVVIGKHFAVKLLRAREGGRKLGAEAVSRMLREAKTLSRFEHPNVIAVTDFGYLSPSEPFIVMELLGGESLRAVLARGRLPWARVRTLGLQMLDGLEAAHAQGVVHRDIKPGNLFVSEDDKVKIIDFGLAGWRRAEESGETRITAHGDVFGTPQYMSPEQIGGEKTDVRTDLYSLGCVLFEMLAGRPPAQGTPAELLYQHVYADPPPLHDLVEDEVPRYVCDLVLQCLQKRPDARPQSVAQLREGLVSGGPAHTRAPRASRRWRWPAAAGLAVAATLLVGAAWTPPGSSVGTSPTMRAMPTVSVVVPRVAAEVGATAGLHAELPTLEVAERKPGGTTRAAVEPQPSRAARTGRGQRRGARDRARASTHEPDARGDAQPAAKRPQWETADPDIKDPFAAGKAR